jgi:hypothetical protein
MKNASAMKPKLGRGYEGFIKTRKMMCPVKIFGSVDVHSQLQ